MPSVRPHRTPTRRGAGGSPAVVLASVLAVLLVLLTGAPAAQAAPDPPPAAPPPSPASPRAAEAPQGALQQDEDVCARSSQEAPVAVEVTRLTPRAPARADEPFQVSGRLVNCGQDALTGLEVRLSVGGRIRTRSELRLAAAEPVVGGRSLRSQEAESGELAAGASTPFDVRVLVADLRLGRRNGVHPLTVQARARTDGGDRGPVGLASTFVPWFPEGPPAPTRIAWLWPLVDVPRRGPDEVMLDDELAGLVSGGTAGRPAGRLHELLSTAKAGAAGSCEPPAGRSESAPPAPPPAAACRGEAVPITYGVEPSLLHSVEAMTRPYSVLQDGVPVQQPASAAAEQWLTSLREAAQDSSRDSDVLALPFGDPDVVSMSRADTGLRAQVEPLRRLGESEVARVLGAEPLPSVAWPPPGPLPAALDVVVGGQSRAVVLDASALPPASGSRNRTPSARSELPSVTGPVSGLLVEPVLSALLESPGGGALPGEEVSPGGGGRLAEQRWIAETAMIAAETPSTSRTLLVAPHRLATVDPDVAAAVLADTGRLPWLCPVPLADVAAGRERCAELPDEQGPATAEPTEAPDPTASAPYLGNAGLSPSFTDRLAEVSLAADQFPEAILVPGSESPAATRARLLRATGRAASAAWREQPLQGREMLRLLEQDVAALRAKVRLVSGPITLTGSSGTLPLLVQNELDQPVTVGVVLDETSAARLSLSTSGAQVVPARELYERISVQVEPRTSGRFVVLASLVDAQGRRFGDPVPLPVRSTGYGEVALAVTWAAAAVLMAAAGTRIVRRMMRHRRAAG